MASAFSFGTLWDVPFQLVASTTSTFLDFRRLLGLGATGAPGDGNADRASRVAAARDKCCICFMAILRSSVSTQRELQAQQVIPFPRAARKRHRGRPVIRIRQAEMIAGGLGVH